MEKVQQKQGIKVNMNEQKIIEFFSENPDFFIKYPAILTCMRLPSKTNGNVSSFEEFQITKLRSRTDNLVKRNKLLVQTSLQNLKSEEDIHRLVVKLVRAQNMEELNTTLAIDLKDNLSLDNVHLLTVAKGKSKNTITKKAIEKLFGESSGRVALRTIYEDTSAVIHGSKKKDIHSDALLKLTDHNGKTIGILVLGSEEKRRFHPGQGVELLEFLASIMGACLERLTSVQNSK